MCHIIWGRSLSSQHAEHDSLSDFTFINHQRNQCRDEAHGDECEGEGQPVGSVYELLGAVVEVKRVHVDEEVLNIRVGVEAVDQSTQLLQTFSQLMVWSAKGRKSTSAHPDQWFMTSPLILESMNEWIILCNMTTFGFGIFQFHDFLETKHIILIHFKMITNPIRWY